MTTDRRLIFLMTVGYRRLQRGIEQHTLAEDGLTSAQSGVLFFLGRNDGALIGDISAALDIVPSAITGLADRIHPAGVAVPAVENHGDVDICLLYTSPSPRD